MPYRTIEWDGMIYYDEKLEMVMIRRVMILYATIEEFLLFSFSAYYSQHRWQLNHYDLKLRSLIA
jgi:hypothetical protein